MHELGIAIRIVDIVSKMAVQHGLSSVETVNVEIGELTGIVPEALTFSFEAAKKNTCMEHATLLMNIIPGRACCNNCKFEFNPGGYISVCPHCNSTDSTIINGKELYVQSIIPGNSKTDRMPETR
jgi:hydrogenase nickel incorporation protein HypA/HybF